MYLTTGEIVLLVVYVLLALALIVILIKTAGVQRKKNVSQKAQEAQARSHAKKLVIYADKEICDPGPSEPE